MSASRAATLCAISKGWWSPTPWTATTATRLFVAGTLLHLHGVGKWGALHHLRRLGGAGHRLRDVEGKLRGRLRTRSDGNREVSLGAVGSLGNVGKRDSRGRIDADDTRIAEATL